MSEKQAKSNSTSIWTLGKGVENGGVGSLTHKTAEMTDTKKP